MANNKKPNPVEAARASIKKDSDNKTLVIFEECHDDPKPTVTLPPRGRRRTRPPEHLRDDMPEHSDEAYYMAQAALRADGVEQVDQAVGPSDYHRGGPKLRSNELQGIVQLYTEKFGPILSLDEAADVTKLSKQTLRRYVCEGKFASSVFRGRPLRFVTQRLLEEVLA